MEKATLCFRIYKIWQIFKCFSRAFQFSKIVDFEGCDVIFGFSKKNVKTTNILNMIKSYPSVENVSLISSYLTTYDCQHLTFFVDEWSRRRQNPDTLTSWTQVTNRIVSLLLLHRRCRCLSLWSGSEFLNLVILQIKYFFLTHYQ